MTNAEVFNEALRLLPDEERCKEHDARCDAVRPEGG
jgi:hypothetical protein